MITTLKVCICILIGWVCSFLKTLNAATIYTYPTVELFDNIHSGTDKTQFVDDAIYFSLNKTALAQINQQKLETMTLQIPFEATKKLEVHLEKAAFLADDFKVTIQSGGTHNTLSYSPNLFYRGAISGVKDAFVTISFSKQSLTGVLSLDGENYNIGPYGGNDSATFVIFKERNLNASNPFACTTEDLKELVINKSDSPNSRSNNKVAVYVECDYALFKANGSSAQQTTDFAAGLFNVVSAIYANDGIDLKLSEIKIWSTKDPYPTSSAKSARDAFGVALNGTFNGDIAHLLSNYKVNGTVPNGGSANINALCDKKKAVGYTNITTSYKDYPTYSWTVYAVTHEIGHNLGSPHTHSCLWPIGPIDNCWCPEGDCGLGDEPASTGGTIMSYCHLNPQWTNDCDLSASNPGINLAGGFGELPGALMRNSISKASCLGNGGAVALPFQAVAKVEDAACNLANGAIKLKVSFGQTPYTYAWNSGETSKDLLAIYAGTYSCTITDAAGKTTVVNVTVDNKQPFTINAGDDQLIDCANPIVSLDGSNSPSGFSYHYDWTSLNGNLYGNTNGAIISVSEAGRYVMSVRNEDTGCVVKDTVMVTENFSQPQLSIKGEAITCAKPTVYLKGLSNDEIINYKWEGQNGLISNNQEIEVKEQGEYTLTVVSANGCATTQVYVVEVNTEVPIVELKANDLDCANPATELKAIHSQNNLIFDWTGPNQFTANLERPIVSIPGVYTLTIRNQSGCTNTSSITVNQVEASSIKFSPIGVITCEQNVVTIDASESQLTENVIVEWTSDDGNILHQLNDLMITVDQAGTYALTVRDLETECVTVETVKVAALPTISAKIYDHSLLTCTSTTLTLSAKAGEYSEHTIFNWTTEEGNIMSDITEREISVSKPGYYTLLAIDTLTGCSDATFTQVIEARRPEVKISTPEILSCLNPTIILSGESSEINANTKINWTFNGEMIPNSNDLFLAIDTEGVYNMSMIDTVNLCESSAEIRIVRHKDPEVNIDDLVHDVCGKAEGRIRLKIESDEGYKIEWNNGATDKKISQLKEGVYTATVIDDFGCQTVISQRVQAPNPITLRDIQIKPISCNNESNGQIEVALQGGNFPYETQWTNGETGLTVGGLTEGIHTLEVVDAKNCVTSFDFPLNAPNPLEVKLEVVHNDVVVVVAGGSPDYKFTWSDGTTKIYGSNFEPGTHSLTIEDANGCSITEFFEIDATTSSVSFDYDLEIMAFPNPTTDYFKVKKELSSFGPIEMAVFTASGKQVYFSKSDSSIIDIIIETNDWNAGTYFLRVITEEGISVNKLQVVKL